MADFIIIMLMIAKFGCSHEHDGFRLARAIRQDFAEKTIWGVQDAPAAKARRLKMQATKFQLWTIGHSNHPLSRFVELLSSVNIAVLADIRRFPHSRSLSHFNQDALSGTLGSAGIEYRWLEGLGGRRPKAASESPTLNTAWRNQSFRNYADYMMGDSFEAAFDELAAIAAARRTAIMCSESVFWRCHRRLVSDFAVAHGAAVMHIFPDGRIAPHNLTNEAVVLEQDHRKVIYPGKSQADELP